MLDIFRGLKNLIKVSHVHIDSPVFRLHYSITVLILVAFSLIVTTRQYVGNPIDCIHSKDIPEDVLNTYCWIHSTYTLKSAFQSVVGRDTPFRGVDNSRGNTKDRKTYMYYQWVCFCLFFQFPGEYLTWYRSIVFFIFEGHLYSRSVIHNLLKKRIYNIDGAIFKLSYRFSTSILVLFFVILSAKQYVGTPIECNHMKDVDNSLFSSYCWIHSTYIVPSAMNKKVGVEVPYPGVDNSKNKEVRFQYYYQWVSLCLLLQAILFYMPRWLWKNWEGGKIHALIMDLDVGICSEVEKKQKKKLLLDYLWENLRFHNWWAYRYYLCEVLALGNVIGQMFLMDRFFDGEFLTFGIKVLTFMESDQEDRYDPMIYIFPRMTKCQFHMFGFGGEVQTLDAVCILPLNVVNEKIYIFLWFWFLILAVLSFGCVVYRIIIIISPRMRVYLLRMRFRLVRRDAIDTLVKRSRMGDWFLFYMLGVNVDCIIFRDVMHELASKLANHHHHHHVPGLGSGKEIQEA